MGKDKKAKPPRSGRAPANPPGAGIRPDVMKNLRDHISAQSSEPWERLASALPPDVETKAELQPARLCVKYTFFHKDMGEAGHIRAIFAGDGMSLSQLACGIRSDKDAFTDDRRILMLGIYETAKAAFGEG